MKASNLTLSRGGGGKSSDGLDSGPQVYRLVVLGTGGVGKSALVIRYVTQNFVEDYDPTIEDCYQKVISLDGKSTKLEIVDTAGQEGFSSLHDQWILRGRGFLLVYSITSRQSFDSLQKFYQSIMTVKEADYAPIAIIGNKCDLEDQRQVPMELGKELAAKWNCHFFETSAKENYNHSIPFEDIVRDLKKEDAKSRLESGANLEQSMSLKCVDRCCLL